MKIKICGINTQKNADIAVSCGADALGFLVGITHLAEDKIAIEDAKKIISSIAGKCKSVAVTHLTDTKSILDLCDYLSPDILQIHDYIPPEQVSLIKSQIPKISVVKAVHIINGEGEDAVLKAKSFQNVCDAVLLDSRTADRLGGTGITHDWNISRRIASELEIPVVLAGGLNSENVYDAVKTVRPFAVDVNSGVETNGDKDAEKILKFIENAKKAELNYLKGI